MPDVPARIGVRLFRWSTGDFRRDPESIDGEHDPRYIAFPCTPEAVAEMRERIDNVIHAYTDSHGVADAVLRELGFTDDA